MTPHQPDDECARPVELAPTALRGLAPGIFPASVYRCSDPDEALALLAGEADGYAYQRDGHPNADLLAEKCRRLHDAAWALVTSTGMSALAVAALTLLRAGDHVVASSQLYGRTTQLFTRQLPRLGIQVTAVSPQDLDSVRAALRPVTRLVVVETLTNPMLRVAPIAQLAEITHATSARLLVDNTFATPIVCQPFRHGADYVVESISKMLNGHSDVMLGLLCGCDDRRAEFQDTLSVWGMSSSPFDSWLALRGLATLHLRMERAGATAQYVADQLAAHPAVARVAYPGRENDPDYRLARQLFEASRSGNMVAFELRQGLDAVRTLLRHAAEIPFCPSLGEVSTTLSHPASTSHRGISATERAALGIGDGTVRLSVGTESTDWVWRTLKSALDQLG
jgi:cystathionine beta-lyase/cystathionine gamma-synthase